jgi:anti-anti-sigma factor
MILQLSEVICPYSNLDASTVPKFKLQVSAEIEKKPLVLLINLKNVTQMDSTGLGCLVTILRKIREVGGEMAISSVTGQVSELFELTCMDKIFKVIQATS